MKKQCTKCKVEKNSTEFHKDNSQKDKRRIICKECAKINNEQYYRENTEKFKGYNKKRYYSTLERSRWRNKKYYKENIDKIKALNKTAKYRFRSIKYRSKKKQIPVCTREEFITWFDSCKSQCWYCGLTAEQHFIIYNSRKGLEIDRKIPKNGYVMKNLVIACYTCNRLKSDFFTYEEWLKIANDYIKPRHKECLKKLD